MQKGTSRSKLMHSHEVAIDYGSYKYCEKSRFYSGKHAVMEFFVHLYVCVLCMYLMVLVLAMHFVFCVCVVF